MNTNLKKAKELLETEGYTCVLYNGEVMLTSNLRGVKPLADWYTDGLKFQGYFAADRVVGKAAAFLYVVLGVECVYARVISEPALSVLQNNNIPVLYDNLVAAIKNRAGTGFCPMETAVLDIDSPDEAVAAVLNKLKQMANM